MNEIMKAYDTFANAAKQAHSKVVLTSAREMTGGNL
jgi:hypothetical protein